MNTSIRKIFSAILVLTMLFGIAACGKDKDKTTTAPETTTEETTAASDETQAPVNGETSEETTAAAPSDTTAAPSTTEAATAGETKAPATEAPVSGKPSTKEEIVKYYETAVNKVKSQAKSVAKVYSNAEHYKNILELGNYSALKSIASNLMGTFMKADDKRYDFAGTAAIVENFPPRKVSNVKIDPSTIAEAKCDDKGTYYEVYLKANSSESNPDVNPPTGGGKVGQFVNVVEEKQITDAAGNMVQFKNLENRYFDAWVKAKIDKATGNITELETYLPSVMYFGEVKVTLINAKDISVGLAYIEKWVVNW